MWSTRRRRVRDRLPEGIRRIRKRILGEQFNEAPEQGSPFVCRGCWQDDEQREGILSGYSQCDNALKRDQQLSRGPLTNVGAMDSDSFFNSEVGLPIWPCRQALQEGHTDRRVRDIQAAVRRPGEKGILACVPDLKRGPSLLRLYHTERPLCFLDAGAPASTVR